MPLEKLFDQKNASANKLIVGAGLKAMVRDLRIYRIALSDKQVGVIRTNALSGKTGSGSDARGPGGGEFGIEDAARALPKISQLVSLPDVSVTTVIGHLPRLPYRIPGVYRNGAAGPELRVNWPAPADNAQVRKAGTYALTGSVPGTKLQPKAHITVKAQTAAKETPAPKRKMETFGLGLASAHGVVDGFRVE